MIDQHWVILGVSLQIFGTGSYVLATLNGKTKPNKLSWFLVSIPPLIAFAAEINKGIGLQALMTFAVGFSPFVIFLSSFFNPKAYWKITKFDYACGALSILGLLLWIILREGNVAIIASIFADVSAFLPTIIKSYRHPETESPWVFLIAAFSAAITLLTAKSFSVAEVAFPLYIFLIGVVLFILIRFKPGKTLNALKAVQ